jgi:hypothetical protein
MTTPVVFSGRYRSFRGALLLVVGLYSATGVNPKELQTITGSLISAKFYLLVASLILASAFQ